MSLTLFALSLAAVECAFEDLLNHVASNCGDKGAAVDIPASCKTNNTAELPDICQVACKEGFTDSNVPYKTAAQAMFTCSPAHADPHGPRGEWKPPSEDLQCNRKRALHNPFLSVPPAQPAWCFDRGTMWRFR